MTVKASIEHAARELGVELDWGAKIRPGDLYLAERNTGPHLLTAKEIHPCNFIIPVEFPAYPYDVQDCVKVKP